MPETTKPGAAGSSANTPLAQALAGCLFARALPGEIEGLDEAARVAVAGFMAAAAALRAPDQPVIHIDPLADDGARRLRLDRVVHWRTDAGAGLALLPLSIEVRGRPAGEGGGAWTLSDHFGLLAVLRVCAADEA